MAGYIIVTPNSFAWLMVYLWPLFTIYFFATKKPKWAMLLTLVGGVMVLPERIGFDPPILPPIAKNEASVILAFIGCIATAGRDLIKARPGRGVESLYFLLVFAAVMTIFGNTNTLVYGVSIFPGMTPTDTVLYLFTDAFSIAIPFFLGRALFRSIDDLREFARFMVSAGLVYSIVCFYEIRFSPQTHRWLYGYFQHEFNQTIRGSTYRPMVCMAHGLAVVMFMVMCMGLSVPVMNQKLKVLGMNNKWIPFWLLAEVVASKSGSASVYALIGFLMVNYVKPKLQVRLGLTMAVLLIAYPTTKLSGLFPVDQILAISKSINEERAVSLEARMNNDKLLMEKAKEKLLFGWGAFGRPRVVDELGEDKAVPDGWWIITLGERGAVGLGAMFGFLLLPLLWGAKAVKKLKDDKDKKMLAAMVMLQGFYCFDLAPNDLYNPIPLLFAGVILGVSEGVLKAPAKAKAQAQVKVTVAAPQPQAQPPQAAPQRA